MLRFYLFSLYLVMLVSVALWLLLFFSINPFQAPFWIIIVFYATIILFLTALFGIIGFYLKVWVSNREIVFAHLVPTLRQGFFISLIVVGLLFLEQMNILNWWIGLMLVVAMSLIELFFRFRGVHK